MFSWTIKFSKRPKEIILRVSLSIIAYFWELADLGPEKIIPNLATSRNTIPDAIFTSPPPQTLMKTQSLCVHCLALLSHVITQYGDGTGYQDLVIPHLSSISNISHANPKAERKTSPEPNTSIHTPTCVICIKSLILFDAARAHVSFEPSLRNTPQYEWSLSWRVDVPDSKIYPQFAFPHNSVSVHINIAHKGGYGWVIGGFKIYPDWVTGLKEGLDRRENLGNHPIIVNLDPMSDIRQQKLDFSSTISSGSRELVASWAQGCEKSHSKCNRIFGNNGLLQDIASWFPDRLIRISHRNSEKSVKSDRFRGKLTAHVVLKSDRSEFPPDKIAAGINYLSFSHCWGLSPDPSGLLGGRVGTVLTELNLSQWRVNLPLDDLPIAFRQALMVCTSLGFEYIWIDSLCILQDSLDDWQVQSAVMGDIYKYAWLNIAALSSESDYKGFCNDNRDPRVEFGFRTPFAPILGRSNKEENSAEQACVLLYGVAKFLWNFEAAIPGCNASNAPLFQRAWVFQERSLARRTLALTRNSLYWACDECSRGEQPEWALGGLESSGLRRTLHSIFDTITLLGFNAVEIDVALRQDKISLEKVLDMLKSIDMRWHACVTSYTLCKLTKHTDKLIAISSIARELASTQLSKRTYLAGLWDVNLPFQMAWITVKGQSTPPRKRVGMAEYVAPSWSWASLEAPVQPRLIFPSGMIALADIRAAKVELKTSFVFGSAKAGWIRVSGRLNSVKKAEMKASSWNAANQGIALTDAATGENLWFCSDTVEGYELVKSCKGWEKVVWTPLTLRCDSNMVECICLCLIKVQVKEGNSSENSFVKPGEKMYRRLGTGNFGRIPKMLQQDKLLMSLGSFTNVNGQGHGILDGFRRSEAGFEDFVLI